MARVSMSNLFDYAETFTTNSRLSSDIMAALDSQGVTEGDLQEGDELLTIAKQKAALQDAATEALRLHTPVFEAAEKQAHSDYQDLVGACRAELSPAQIKALNIKNRPANAAKFVQTTNTLLDAIPRNPEIAAILAKRKRDAARLAQIRVAVKNYDDAATKMQRLSGALKQATTDQNNAIQPLQAWFTKMSRFAKLGLKGKKDLLGQILPKTTKKSTKIQTPNTTPQS